MLKRREESDTYLTTVSGHRWSRQTTMKVDKSLIKNVLKRRKEGGTYLVTDSRHRWRV